MKKIRLYFWLLTGILERYYKIILISFFGGVLLVVAALNFGPQIVSLIKRSHKVIGLVGNFTPSTLPLNIQRLISSGLTDINESGEVIPAIATAWEITDEGKTYTFHIRSNLYWHDGQKFSAADINYNLKDVEFIPKSLDELQVKLKSQFTPLPSFLSKPVFKKGLVGLGSYKIAAIKLKGDTVANLTLTSAASDLPVLEFKFYSSESVAKIAFQLGEVDRLVEITNPVPLSESKNVKINEVVKYNWYVGVFYNNEDPFLKEKAVRQALTLAIDKPEKNRTSTPLSTKSWAYTNKVKQYDKDLAGAKKIMTKYIGSESATLTISTFNDNVQLSSVIASAWEAIGVASQVQVVSGLPDKYQVLVATQEIPPDPDQYAMWHSTQIENNTNISRYTNVKIDKLLEDGRKETDMEKRKKIYQDFQRYLVEDAPAAFLYHPTTYTIYR